MKPLCSNVSPSGKDLKISSGPLKNTTLNDCRRLPVTETSDLFELSVQKYTDITVVFGDTLFTVFPKRVCTLCNKINDIFLDTPLCVFGYNIKLY